MTTLGGKLYAVGGRWSDRGNLGPHFATLPTPRHGLASAVVSGRWYVIGGGARAGALTFVSLTDLVEVFPARSE